MLKSRPRNSFALASQSQGLNFVVALASFSAERNLTGKGGLLVSVPVVEKVHWLIGADDLLAVSTAEKLCTHEVLRNLAVARVCKAAYCSKARVRLQASKVEALLLKKDRGCQTKLPCFAYCHGIAAVPKVLELLCFATHERICFWDIVASSSWKCQCTDYPFHT